MPTAPSEHAPPCSLADVLGSQLGKGGFGSVFAATRKRTGRKVAIKRLQTEGGSGGTSEAEVREVRCYGISTCAPSRSHKLEFNEALPLPCGSRCQAAPATTQPADSRAFFPNLAGGGPHVQTRPSARDPDLRCILLAGGRQGGRCGC